MKQIVTLFVAVFFWLNTAYSATQSGILDIDPDTQIVKDHIVKKTAADIIFLIDYPQITGKHLSVNAKKFNTIVIKKIKQNMVEFQKEVELWKSNAIDNGLDSYVLDSPGYYFGKYKVYLIKPQGKPVISVLFNSETHSEAGTGEDIDGVINYNLTTGKELRLKELFAASANYVSFLTNYSNQILLSNDLIELNPKDENYKNWILTEKGLSIQIEMGALGLQEINIPYSDLKTAPLSSWLTVCADNSEKCLADQETPNTTSTK